MTFSVRRLQSDAMRRLLVATLAALALLALSIVRPAPANAEGEIGGFCGNVTLEGGINHYCQGPWVALYEIGGWGDQHSVCVRGLTVGLETCSGGPGVVTYDPYGFRTSDAPQIWNHAAGANRVHGFYYH